MATTAETFIGEIDALLDKFAPKREGLYDYDRLDIKDHTREEIAAYAGRLDALMQALQKVRDDLEALIEVGYPELPVREIDASAVADLDDQIRTLTAGRTLFASNAATSMVLEGAKPVPKT